jgi:hypothetical protein
MQSRAWRCTKDPLTAWATRHPTFSIFRGKRRRRLAEAGAGRNKTRSDWWRRKFFRVSQSFYLGGGPSGPCGSAPLNFSFPNPAFFAIRIAHALPTPILSALAGKQQLELTATLNLQSVVFSQHPPSLADLLPPEFRKMARQSPQSPPTGEFITFDTTFDEARWHDANSARSRGTISMAW